MTLTIQDLGALGELLGSIAVLVTLVYLATQTRQNTMAISAQLDAARIDTTMQVSLAAATSSEILEALNEDRVNEIPIGQTRRNLYWRTNLLGAQWQFLQAQRGLLPTFNEIGMAWAITSYFTTFRSYQGWWEDVRAGFSPAFVEFVEEQRSKAA